MKVFVTIAEFHSCNIGCIALSLLTSLTKSRVVLWNGFQFLFSLFLASAPDLGYDGGPPNSGEPPRHNRDRHYNYPREDAVLIQTPLADKAATLYIDIAEDDIGRKINTGTA